MILTGARFAEIGEALFGPRWRPIMAKRLNRTERMIWNYQHECRNLPLDLRLRILALLEDKTAELVELRDNIPAPSRSVAKLNSKAVIKALNGRKSLRLPVRRDLTWVYVVCWDTDGPSKVGVTDILAERCLGLQTGNPFQLIVFSAAAVKDADLARGVEMAILNQFAEQRMRGEWINISATVLTEAILRITNELSVEVADYYHDAKRYRKPGTSDVAEQFQAGLGSNGH